MAELFVPKNVRRFKSIRHFKTPSRSHVIVLPTCKLPLSHLVEENWGRNVNVGTTRMVLRIDSLANGQRVTDKSRRPIVLFLKSPELEFKPNRPQDPWLCGWDFGVLLDDPKDMRIQKQAVWEARILLGLKKKGIRAEVPQAIIIDNEGNRSVVTRGINAPVVRSLIIRSADRERFRRRVKCKGFVPIDLWDNVIGDKSRHLHVIDVNRWEWPPFIDVYKKRLLEAIAESAKTGKPKPPVRL